MDFPSFDDFRATLTDKRLHEIIGTYEINDIIQVSDITDPDNISALIEEMFRTTLVHANVLTLRMLQAYHEWLGSQL